MSETLEYDVFLSHSAKDKAVVRDVAERLRKDGHPKNTQHSTINSQLSAGLDRSRVLVLCMSANAFGSDWAQLESGTFQMQGHHALRDPLNKERRFLPLRLDDVPIKGSLAQFLYINWLPAASEKKYAKLLIPGRVITMAF